MFQVISVTQSNKSMDYVNVNVQSTDSWTSWRNLKIHAYIYETFQYEMYLYSMFKGNKQTKNKNKKIKMIKVLYVG